MGQFNSELTRKYLLNSHSRGSLEEVTSVDAEIDAENQELMTNDTQPWLDKNNFGVGSSEGNELTQTYFREYYD
ncbi:hypothetical protein D3C77_539820 [compost metagenome]